MATVDIYFFADELVILVVHGVQHDDWVAFYQRCNQRKIKRRERKKKRERERKRKMKRKIKRTIKRKIKRKNNRKRKNDCFCKRFSFFS